MNFLQRLVHSWRRHPQRKTRNAVIALRDLQNGDSARIVQIVSPSQSEAEAPLPGCCAARLEALGLRVGKIVEKVSGMPFHGPVTLLLDGRQIAVGWNISSNVLVTPLKESEHPHGQTTDQG